MVNKRQSFCKHTLDVIRSIASLVLQFLVLLRFAMVLLHQVA
ncbi:unnamed protein product, partial [Arabidopsis halleri]